MLTFARSLNPRKISLGIVVERTFIKVLRHRVKKTVRSDTGCERRPTMASRSTSASSARTSAAPAASARILPRAASRLRGTRPQSVHGISRAAGTYGSARRMRAGHHLRRLDLLGADVDRRRAGRPCPPARAARPRPPRGRALDRHLVDAALAPAAAASRRSGPSRCSAASRPAPARAVAVADVHGLPRAHAVHRTAPAPRCPTPPPRRGRC